MKKYILGICLSFFFFGCSNLFTAIGNRDIENSVRIYTVRGLTTDGTRELIDGLNYLPQSVIGINQFNKQYKEITKIKNETLLKRALSERDINSLKLYLYTVEEYSKLRDKPVGINIDYSDYRVSKEKISRAFDKYVLKNKKNLFSRNEKINRISFYRGMNTYIRSGVIENTVKELQQEVSRNIYINTNARYYSRLERLANNIFIETANSNLNRDLGNYTYFRGFRRPQRYSKNDYYIEVYFDNIYVTDIERKEEKGFDNSQIFLDKKRLTVNGTYKIYNNFNLYNIRTFDFSENYTVKTEIKGDSESYSDESKEIREILKKKFNDLIIYKMKNL